MCIFQFTKQRIQKDLIVNFTMERWAIFVLALIAMANVWVVSTAKDADEEDDKKKDNVGTVIGIDLGTTYSW